MNSDHILKISMLITAAIARSVQHLIDTNVLELRGQNFAINGQIMQWATLFIEEHSDKLSVGSEEFQQVIDDFVTKQVIQLSQNSEDGKTILN